MVTRIVSVNVNGVRAAYRKGMGEWLAGRGVDILCLQEVRAETADLVALDLRSIPLNATYLTSGVTMAEGDVLVLQHEKVGTGLAIPELLVEVTYKPN